MIVGRGLRTPTFSIRILNFILILNLYCRGEDTPTYADDYNGHRYKNMTIWHIFDEEK